MACLLTIRNTKKLKKHSQAGSLKRFFSHVYKAANSEKSETWTSRHANSETSRTCLIRASAPTFANSTYLTTKWARCEASVTCPSSRSSSFVRTVLKRSLSNQPWRIAISNAVSTACQISNSSTYQATSCSICMASSTAHWKSSKYSTLVTMKSWRLSTLRNCASWESLT